MEKYLRNCHLFNDHLAIHFYFWPRLMAIKPIVAVSGTDFITLAIRPEKTKTTNPLLIITQGTHTGVYPVHMHNRWCMQMLIIPTKMV